MRGLCDLAHRAWRGRGLRHWGSLPLHGQVSITRGYSRVSLCLDLFDCASDAERSMISTPRTLVFGGLVGGYHENSIHGRYETRCHNSRSFGWTLPLPDPSSICG